MLLTNRVRLQLSIPLGILAVPGTRTNPGAVPGWAPKLGHTGTAPPKSFLRENKPKAGHNCEEITALRGSQPCPKRRKTTQKRTRLNFWEHRTLCWGRSFHQELSPACPVCPHRMCPDLQLQVFQAGITMHHPRCIPVPSSKHCLLFMSHLRSKQTRRGNCRDTENRPGKSSVWPRLRDRGGAVIRHKNHAERAGGMSRRKARTMKT